MNSELSVGLASIVVIDLVLAGDNAVVIGMAARPLPARQRRQAIRLGAVLAVALRVLATVVVAQLLLVPFLSALGGLLVCTIAFKLLVTQDATDMAARKIESFGHAVRLIVLSDLVMSLDNILAVGGASGGSLPLILFGLLLSIPLVMSCSAAIAALLDRYPALAQLGAAILGWTGGQMILHDLLPAGPGMGLLSLEALGPWRNIIPWGVKLGLAVGVVAAARLWRRRRRPLPLLLEPCVAPGGDTLQD